MYIYRYQKADNLKLAMLRRGEIYFASKDELNDANECRPRLILKGKKELWCRLAYLILFEVGIRFGVHRKQTEFQRILELSDSIGQNLKRQVGNRDIGLEDLAPLFVKALEPLITSDFSTLPSRLLIRLCQDYIIRDLPGLTVENYYITSFSGNATNPTMWGHYADAERGFVIVYETDGICIGVESPINILNGFRAINEEQGFWETGRYRQDFLELKHVEYRKRPPKVNAFHQLTSKFLYSEMEDHYDVPLLLAGDAEDKEEQKMGLIKYLDWRYEDEWRCFFPSIGQSVLPDVRALKVSRKNIRGVVFGPRMDDVMRSRVILCCHLLMASYNCDQPNDGELPDFAFLEAIQIVDRFDFRIRPIGILGGRYFSGFLPLKKVRDLDSERVERLQRLTASVEASGKR